MGKRGEEREREDRRGEEMRRSEGRRVTVVQCLFDLNRRES